MSQLKSLLIALILVGGVSLVSAANTWTAPTVAAPNGNVDAPVNVSPVTQFKKGGLVLEGLNAAGEILAYPFSVINGNVGIGTAMPKGKLSVMGTALANDFCIHDAAGVSTGKCLSGSTGGSTSGGTAGVSKVIAGTGVSVSPSEGTGDVTISSTGGIAATPAGWRSTLSCGPYLTNPVGLPGAQANASAISFKYAYTNGGNTYVYVSEPMMAVQRVTVNQNVPFTMILWQVYNSAGSPLGLYQTYYNSMQYNYSAASLPCTTGPKI
jgi:hypothetical protein